jgi:hypothetical protein
MRAGSDGTSQTITTSIAIISSSTTQPNSQLPTPSNNSFLHCAIASRVSKPQSFCCCQVSSFVLLESGRSAFRRLGNREIESGDRHLKSLLYTLPHLSFHPQTQIFYLLLPTSQVLQHLRNRISTPPSSGLRVSILARNLPPSLFLHAIIILLMADASGISIALSPYEIFTSSIKKHTLAFPSRHSTSLLSHSPNRLIINRHNSTSPYRYGSFILILCFIRATLGKKILVESLYSALSRFQEPAAFPPSPEAPSFLHLPTSLLLVFLILLHTITASHHFGFSV